MTEDDCWLGERFKKLFKIVCGIIFLEWYAWSHSITPFLLTLRLWSWYLNLYWPIQLSPQTRKIRGKTLHVWCNPVTLMERQQLRRRSHTGPKWPQIPKISVFWPPSLSVCVCLCYRFWSLKWSQGKWGGNSSLTNCKSRFITLCGSSAHKHHDFGCCLGVAKLRMENFDSCKPFQPW